MADKGSNDIHDKLLYCSFCGKSQHEVQRLIAGPQVVATSFATRQK